MKRDDVFAWLKKTYDCEPEYLWRRYPEFAVFRNKENKKWFALIMRVSARKLGIDSDDEVDILNIKCDPILIGTFRDKKGFFPAYHMNKENWISVQLFEGIDENTTCGLIDLSRELCSSKSEE